MSFLSKLLLLVAYGAVTYPQQVALASNMDGGLSQQAAPPIIVTPPEITRLAPATKINQLIGDFDRQFQRLTENLTFQRYQLPSTDLGVSFQHQGRTYVAFGDSVASRDPLAWSEDTDPEDGFSLRFQTNNNGSWKPITIPGITQGALEVPVEGISLSNLMYLWHTTDSTQERMGRSVLARSPDNGSSFSLVRTFSALHFINVSVIQQEAGDWPGSPSASGAALYVFGSGEYRKSDVRLGFLMTDQIEQSTGMKYFSGLVDGIPRWSDAETAALPLFEHPAVGELSVTYDNALKRWLMLYNSGSPRGIVLRSAINPWGPWSEPKVVFDAATDSGYCYFVHSSWLVNNCDNVSDPGRENTWGGEYGPYMLRHLARTVPDGRRIYFTMSTWNPYTVVLMKVDLARLPNNSATRPALALSRSTDRNHVIASWEKPSYGWFLERKRTLSATEPWERVRYSPTILGSRISAVLDDDPAGAFFRLVQP
jgi:Domain of unknown function (DUF4185)